MTDAEIARKLRALMTQIENAHAEMGVVATQAFRNSLPKEQVAKAEAAYARAGKVHAAMHKALYGAAKAGGLVAYLGK